MSIGGAIAGGARLAMASTFDPATFWDETRRYGVTVASYTWTLLHDLVEAPPNPGERHHPVRLFIGSGMPSGLWRRVQSRFRPARVLEFYASTEAGAILVNLSGAKPGSMGRPLPGSAEVKVAAYDVELGKLVLGQGGLGVECGPDEVGMLLARVSDEEPISTTPWRGVFSRDDAWLPTGDLFRRDRDGDYWRLDSIADVIHTINGPVFTAPIRDALGTIPAIDLAVAYGVSASRGNEVAVAAVTLRPGAQLTAKELTRALDPLPASERPAIVHVVDAIPVTTWYRPLTGSLREAGVPSANDTLPTWYLDEQRHTYRPLTATAQRKLAGQRA
jgi:putative long chain acyl-CoA synthase